MVYGRELTPNEYLAVLRKYDLRDALCIVSQIAIIFESNATPLSYLSWEAQEKAARSYFSLKCLLAIEDYMKRKSKGKHFHLFSQQISLALTKAIVILGSIEGVTIDRESESDQTREEVREDIATMVLGTGDFLYDQIKAKARGLSLDEALSSLVSSYNINAELADPVDLISRYSEIYLELPKDPAYQAKFAEENPFASYSEELFGVSFFRLFSLANAISNHYLFQVLKDNNIVTKNFFIGPEYFFSNVTWADEEKVKKLFSLFAHETIDELKKEIGMIDLNHGIDYNITPFIQKPLLMLNEKTCICISPKLLLERTTKGLFWFFFDELISQGRAAEAEQLKSKYGMLFELYVHKMLTEAFGNDYFLPAEEPKRGRCDGIIFSEKSAVFIEIKAQNIKLTELASGDVPQIKAKMQEIFIEKRGGKRGACKQIEESIADFRAGRLTTSNRGDVGISEYFRVVVTEQSLFPVPELWKEVNQKANEMMPKSGLIELPIIHHPYIFINIHELEILVNLQESGVPIEDVLRGFLSSSEFTLTNYVCFYRPLRERSNKSTRMLDKARQVIENVSKELGIGLT